MRKPKVYYLQNRAIQSARFQLEAKGILNPWASLDQVREMAADLNLGIRSISKLSLKQREILIDRLTTMGARVKNPHLYKSDLEEEVRISGSMEPRKIILFSQPKDSQLRMLDTLANQIFWRIPDGYLRFCHKLLKSPRPRNSREVTKLRLALFSLLQQQDAGAADHFISKQSNAGLP